MAKEMRGKYNYSIFIMSVESGRTEGRRDALMRISHKPKQSSGEKEVKPIKILKESKEFIIRIAAALSLFI